jgi:hypothetical protein
MSRKKLRLDRRRFFLVIQPTLFVIAEEVLRVVAFSCGFSAAGGKARVCKTRPAGRR